jgi:hypothetical protein
MKSDAAINTDSVVSNRSSSIPAAVKVAATSLCAVAILLRRAFS